MTTVIRTSSDIIRESKLLIEFMCNCKLVEADSDEELDKLASETGCATFSITNKAWRAEENGVLK